LLDKLYFIDRVHQRIDDEPVMSLCIEDRNVVINGICVSPADQRINRGGLTFFLNREDAEEKLKTIVL
jgi:hypothetical protein